jgi:hypothetical protein
MEWIAVAAVLVIVVLVIRAANQRQLREHDQVHRGFEQLTAVKLATEEDVVALGLHLQKLDIDLVGIDLDDSARSAHQRAVDAYEAAKASLAVVTSSAEIGSVTTILREGRYAVSCVRAAVAGEPPPARRLPCFFDPRHGESVRDVTWAPAGGSPREVPACALDADRVEAGAEPEVRKVILGTQRVPYWQAGPSFGPWTAGYFGSFDAAGALFVETMMGGVLSGGFDGGLGRPGRDSSGPTPTGVTAGGPASADASADDPGADDDDDRGDDRRTGPDDREPGESGPA